MCIILHTTKKLGLPTEDRLKDNFNFNPDGAGYAIVYTKGKRKKIEHQKGFDKFDTYNLAVTKAFSKLKDDDDYIVLHMRIATSGGKALDKTHPFQAKDGTLIFQNGICPVTVTKHLKKDESDTEWIAKNYIDPDWVKACDGMSRWLIIKPDGTLVKLGTWVTDSAGRSWSNGTYSGYTYTGYNRGYGRGSYGYGYSDDYYEPEAYTFEHDILKIIHARAFHLIEVLKRDFKATYMQSLKAVVVQNTYFYLDESFGHDEWDGVRVIGSLSPHTFDQNIFISSGRYVIHVRDNQHKGHAVTVYLSTALQFVNYLLNKAGYKDLAGFKTGDMSVNFLGNNWGVTCESKDASIIVKVLNDYFIANQKSKVAVQYKKSVNIEHKFLEIPQKNLTTVILDRVFIDELTTNINTWLRNLGVMERIDITYGFVSERTMKLTLTAKLIGSHRWDKYYRNISLGIKSLDPLKLFALEQDDLFMDIYTNLYEGG